MSTDTELVYNIKKAMFVSAVMVGIGMLSKKVVKENFLADPTTNFINWVKFTTLLGTSIYLHKYAEDQGWIPK